MNSRKTTPFVIENLFPHFSKVLVSSNRQFRCNLSNAAFCSNFQTEISCASNLKYGTVVLRLLQEILSPLKAHLFQSVVFNYRCLTVILSLRHPPSQLFSPWLCAFCCCCCGGGGSSPVSLQASVSISQLTISPFPAFLPSDLFYDSHSCLLVSSRFLRLLPGAVTFLSQRIQRILFCVGCIRSARLHYIPPSIQFFLFEPSSSSAVMIDISASFL